VFPRGSGGGERRKRNEKKKGANVMGLNDLPSLQSISPPWGYVGLRKTGVKFSDTPGVALGIGAKPTEGEYRMERE